MNCRSILKLAGAGALSTILPAPYVRAQSYPSGPITLVVAWPAGGGSDISMRLVADGLSRKINVPVVVLNKAGAGGAIGHREIITAKPDGYTFGMFSSGGIALPYLNAQANTTDEFEPLAFFGEDPNALSVSIASGINSLKEYVERARANPSKLRNGNDQPGGSSLSGDCAVRAGDEFQGDAGLLWRLRADRDGAARRRNRFGDGADPRRDRASPRRQAARFSACRRPSATIMAPDVPTFKEQGFDVVVGSWRCLVGPKGMPADRVAFLESNLLAVLKDPEFQAKAKQAGFIVGPGDAKMTAARFKSDDAALYPILLEAGLVKARQK